MHIRFSLTAGLFVIYYILQQSNIKKFQNNLCLKLYEFYQKKKRNRKNAIKKKIVVDFETMRIKLVLIGSRLGTIKVPQG